MTMLPIFRSNGALTTVRSKLFGSSPARLLHASPIQHAKPLPPRPVIAEGDIEESFLKGSGPGGQKINKTSSAVQIKHVPTGIVVKSQATRSRSQNRKYARQLLAEKLDELEKGDQSRTAIKAAIKSKKKASASKKSRRKYRALDAEKAAAAAIDGEESGSAAETSDQEVLSGRNEHDDGSDAVSSLRDAR